ncbi:hypothetical protein V6N12_043185 [Hibiscus sabdariffa]|uniref:Uncharacterized protein n=1 Tax=Hibiscus sabdariffa TaxID=183260 RepID=A0ABR2DDL4_9ROSI
MDYGSGGGGGSGSGGDHDVSDPSRRKKPYHRHTAHQIQRLESMFKECPHPDEKQRLQLSRELGLAPRQIKFWFQNRRTQMKAQHERADNSALRTENDKIRCENIAIREALKNVICPSCGGPPVTEDSYFDDQKLRMENAQLKEELDRVSSIAAKYIGRPISQLPPVQPVHISSLDFRMANFDGYGVSGPSLDLDLLPGSSSAMPNLPFQPVIVSDMDKSLMSDIAANAMEEMLRLLQSNEPLWIKSTNDGRDVLNLETYERIFPRPNTHFKSPNVRIEASRDSGVVIMNGLALVDMFMDSNKWVELFPTIVSIAKTIEVISARMMGTQSGSLQLMYEELQNVREVCLSNGIKHVNPGSRGSNSISRWQEKHDEACSKNATTFWLPVSPQNVFSFFKDERTRPQWDVLSNGNAVQEVAHIANGSHPGNCISVLRAFNSSHNNMLILQESCIDSSGSLVVYCPVDLPAINVAMSGEDPSYIPLLPSGFTISPDGHPDQGGDGASTSSSALHGSMGRSGGSLITVAFQILVSSLPSAKLNMDSVTTVNNLIGTTVQQIKAALNCPSS